MCRSDLSTSPFDSFSTAFCCKLLACLAMLCISSDSNLDLSFRFFHSTFSTDFTIGLGSKTQLDIFPRRVICRYWATLQDTFYWILSFRELDDNHLGGCIGLGTNPCCAASGLYDSSNIAKYRFGLGVCYVGVLPLFLRKCRNVLRFAASRRNQSAAQKLHEKSRST